MDTPTTPRRKLSIKDKLRVVLRYLRCPGLPEKNRKCGKRLPDLELIDFDHIQALSRGGDNDLTNFRPLCEECHKFKTQGNGATTLGSDDHEKAKTDRLVNERNGLPKTKQKARKYNWPSRKLKSRGWERRS